MSIRSIDLQVLIPRSTEASRTQQQQQNSPALQQQQVSEHNQQVATARQQQVQQLDKSENKSVHRDADNKKGREEPRKKRPSDKLLTEDEMQQATDPLRGKKIDIST